MHGILGETLTGIGLPHGGPSAAIQVLFEGRLFEGTAERPHPAAHVAEAYAAHGDAFAQHLEGAFAVALLDRPKRRCILARDPAGTVPLYHARTAAGETVFGTRIADLLPHLPRVAPNPRKVQDFFAFFWSIDDETWFDGVAQVPQGAVWANGSVRRYFTFQRMPEQRPAAVWKEAIIDTIRQATARWSHHDAIGCHLSGGIDSSLIVALLQHLRGTPPPAFVASFPEYPQFDESPHAQQVMDQAGGTLHRAHAHPHDFPAVLRHVVAAMEEPKAHPPVWPRYLVERQAKAQGIGRIFTGRGADELFTGYDAHKRAQLPDHRARRRVFAPEERAALFAGALADAGGYSPEDTYDAVFNDCPGATLLEQCMALDWRTLMGNWMALDYKMSGCFGTEVCAPFLDPAVIDLAMRIPIDTLCPGDLPKQLLREAVAVVLPDEIVWRPKVGFRTPMGEMLRDGGLESFVRAALTPDDSAFWEWFQPAGVAHEIDRHFRGEANRGWQLWALLTTRTWFGLYIDDAPAVTDDAAAPASL